MRPRRGSRAVALFSAVAGLLAGSPVASAQTMPLAPVGPPPVSVYPPVVLPGMPPAQPQPVSVEPVVPAAQPPGPPGPPAPPPAPGEGSIAPPYRDTTPPGTGGAGEKKIITGWDDGFYI